MADHAPVVKAVRARDALWRVVRPEPRDVRRQPADAEHQYHYHDETRYLTLGYQTSPVAYTSFAGRTVDGPQLLNHEDAQDEDG